MTTGAKPIGTFERMGKVHEYLYMLGKNRNCRLHRADNTPSLDQSGVLIRRLESSNAAQYRS